MAAYRAMCIWEIEANDVPHALSSGEIGPGTSQGTVQGSGWWM